MTILEKEKKRGKQIMKKTIFWSSTILTLVVLTMGTFTGSGRNGTNDILKPFSSVIAFLKGVTGGQNKKDTEIDKQKGKIAEEFEREIKKQEKLERERKRKEILSGFKVIETSYSIKNKKILLDFETKVLSILNSNTFNQAKVNIPFFVKYVTSYKFSGKLIAAMAYDKIKDTQVAEEMLDPLMEKFFIAPCKQGEAAIIQVMNDTLVQLKENDNEHKAGLVKLMETEDFKLDNILDISDRLLLEDKFNIEQDIRDYAKHKAWNTLGCALEIVFIRSTYSVIKKATVALVGKLATSWGTAGIFAVCDGPIPIGDIIGAVVAAGGTLWTIKDLYDIQKTLPDELQTSMKQKLDEIQEQLKTESLEKLNNIVEECTNDFNACQQKCIDIL